MGLDMYAFSVAPSNVVPNAAAIARYRFPLTGNDLRVGAIVVNHWSGPICAAAFPSYDVWHPQLDDEFLASKYVLPGSTLFHQWRKHPDLHAWMQRMWRVKRRPNSNANFSYRTPIGLDQRDLDALEHGVRNRQLPKGSGPFFGESDGTERADDLDFIAQARTEIARGRLVYYTSWW